MTPEQIKQAHDHQVAELRAAVANANIALEHAAMEVARMVRATAAQRGHSVGIRVVRRTSGVRVTVTGPHASQYRAAVERALSDKVPDAAREIRAQITRRAK